MKNTDFKIINGRKLNKEVPYMNEYFFKDSRGTEKEYLRLLENSQDYFQKLKKGMITPDDQYLIVCDHVKRIGPTSVPYQLVTSQNGYLNDPKKIFFDNPITVVKIGFHYYFDSCDGRHRFFVAKKYGLDILVREINDPDFKKSVIKKKFKSLFLRGKYTLKEALKRDGKQRF